MTRALAHAIDISTAQPIIDWRRVKLAGIRAAWIKASEGAYKSQKRERYLRTMAAEAWRKTIDRGAYHLARIVPGVEAEIDCYRDALRVLSAPLELVHVLDFEHTRQADGTYKARQHPTVHTLAELLDFAARWAEELPRTIIYGARTLLDDTSEWPLPLFVASRPWSPSQPPERLDKLLGSQPKIPWAAWQYVSTEGRVDGIVGAVDRVLYDPEACRA